MDSKNGWTILREPAGAIASSLAVLAVLGYVIGWFYNLAYLSEFSVAWLLPYVPTSSLLQYAEWPIALLAFMIFLAVIEKPKSLWDPYMQDAILRYGLVMVFGLMILLSGPLRSRVDWYVIRNVVFLNMFLWVIVVAYFLKLIFLVLRNDQRASSQGWSRVLIVAGLFATAGGVYAIPRSLGHAAPVYDLHPRSSTLHVVQALDVQGQVKTSRLLLATETRIHTVTIDEPGGRAIVIPVTWDRVLSISAPWDDKKSAP